MNQNFHPQIPSGLMSRANGNYIGVSLPANIKPPPDHINRDKEKVRQEQLRQAEIQRQQEAQNASGGGLSIICTRCHELGLLSDEIYAADELYGARMRESDPDFIAWYLKNARPIVERMHCETLASRVFTKMLWHLFVSPWSTQMAYEITGHGKGNWFGKFLMNAGYVAYVLSIPVGYDGYFKDME